MRRLIHRLFPAPFQFTLVVAFTLVAALSIGIGAWVISRTIDSYLNSLMTDRIARDMRLAQSYYYNRLDLVTDISNRLALDERLIDILREEPQNIRESTTSMEKLLSLHLGGLLHQGNYAAVILTPNGAIIGGSLIVSDKTTPIPPQRQAQFSLEIIHKAYESQQTMSATEILPQYQLSLLGLAEQAYIPLIETPRAAQQLFDEREGSAGLALLSVSPVRQSGKVLGMVVVFHLINNDFTLVDRVKSVAGVDTVTIFLGDQRVSTNVLTAEGERAIGTRLAEDVGEVVLYKGETYIGPAFVVNQNYITRYDPLRDHEGRVVGIIYVGANQERYNLLINAFNQQVAVIALVSILVTFGLAIPVSRTITRPLRELKELVEASNRVSEGDLTARAPVIAGGEVGLVAHSFNAMLDTLQETQDKLLQSEKLASLGQLAAGVAHELNNPLATVLLYADLLKQEASLELEKREDIETIIRETLRCKQIVSGLLNFARQTQVNDQPIQLNQLIQEVFEIERRHERFQTIDLRLELDPHLPIIQADPAQIREVLINLNNNAVDAMSDGGTLTIRTFNRPAGMVTFEVEDTGKGIPPENLSKLFTPFFTTKPVGKGTGLGLAIIYGIVKMHRGQINVRSQIDKGTTFIVSLPVRLQSAGSFPVNADWIGGSSPQR
jgi:two-component system NtrC family sensor kinase